MQPLVSKVGDHRGDDRRPATYDVETALALEAGDPEAPADLLEVEAARHEIERLEQRSRPLRPEHPEHLVALLVGGAARAHALGARHFGGSPDFEGAEAPDRAIVGAVEARGDFVVAVAAPDRAHLSVPDDPPRPRVALDALVDALMDLAQHGAARRAVGRRARALRQ